MLIQRRMLAAYGQTEHRDPNERARERTEGADRVCNLMGRTIPSTSQGTEVKGVIGRGSTFMEASSREEGRGVGGRVYDVKCKYREFPI